MPITPLYSNSTNSRHSKPYLRSTSQQQAGLSSTIRIEGLPDNSSSHFQSIFSRSPAGKKTNKSKQQLQQQQQELATKGLDQEPEQQQQQQHQQQQQQPTTKSVHYPSGTTTG
ncbi:hypothetical protein PSTG_18624, partial [Puccinia striiformis f. sp. tritici PST-78]